jgi:redox-sensitive bicupin YhaK (pirin superfamily)
MGVMSNLDPSPAAVDLPGSPSADRSAFELIAPRRAPVGESTEVARYLPRRGRTTVGAWCFLDYYGPDDVAAGPGMRVGPHPHIGLQTVTWLLDGEVLHRDSLGSVQPIRPGQLNLMTAGAGIAHAEVSPDPHPRWLHGLQLWVALPDADRLAPCSPPARRR